MGAPLGCQETWNSPDGTTTCERGDNGSLYQWAFYYAPLWCVILLVTGLLAWVYCHVHAIENQMTQYVPAAMRRLMPEPEQDTSESRGIAEQAAFYVFGFFTAWLFPTIFQLFIVTTGTFPYPLLLLTAIFVLIQGVFILLVYLRPEYIKFRGDHPDLFFLTAFWRVLRQQLKR